MKKIIYFFGIIFLSIIIVFNLICTTYLSKYETISFTLHSVFYIAGLVIASLLLFFITKFVNDKLYAEESNYKREVRKVLLISFFIIYAAFTILWTICVVPNIGADQIHVCSLAQAMYRGGDVTDILSSNTYANIPLSDYIQGYSQQIPLAFLYSLFFKIIHCDFIALLRILNVISNFLIVLAIYKIGSQLSQKYKINKVLLLTLIMTFISLPMLSTCVYGDIPGLTCCLFSVYFTMKYTETKKIKHLLFSALFMMVAYMFRMNSLIFIIATVMYLLLNLWKEFSKKIWKQSLINLMIIFMFIAICIVPSSIIKTYYLNKYHLDKSKSYPSISYILMAMSDGPRASGWYNEEIGENALKNPENVKVEYTNKIKERLTYFSQNMGDAACFYLSKIGSMWTENTYSAIRNNAVAYYSFENVITPLTLYQKVLLIVTCLCSLLVLIQNRKNISLEILFLITIFIGGFAFHLLWEAKSRYIIPYIVVLIPVASIYLKKIHPLNPKKTN